MALKDEPMPKSTFFGAGTSLVKYPTKISFFHLISTWLQAVKSCWLPAGWLLAAALLRLLLLLWLANACETPPGSKTAWPYKGRTDAKIYVFRGRNVPSEILQKYHVFHLISTLLRAVKSCWLLLAASCCTAAAALTAILLANACETPPSSKTA